MKKLFMLFSCLFIASGAWAVDISGIINPNNWTQTFHSQTYTVGPDGTTLFYRGRSTGMRLPNPQQVGSQITVTDPTIAPRPNPNPNPRPNPNPNPGPNPNPNPGPNPNPNPNPNPGPNPAPRPGVAVTALQVAGGLVMQDQGFEGIVAANSVSEEKKTWGDFASSTASGALAGAGTTAATVAIINIIPVGGQVAWGAATAVGALVGGVGGAIMTGKRIFSETDCEMDPVIKKYVCCNISNLSKINAVRVGIGGEMFADFPFVRTCVQGKQEYTTEQSWLKARFLDDHWSKEGKVKFCSGYVAPDESGDFRIQVYGASESAGTVCWKWECADDGYVRQGNTCVKQGEPQPNKKTKKETCEESGGIWHGVGAGEAGPEWCDCRDKNKTWNGTRCVIKGGENNIDICVKSRKTEIGKACCYVSNSVAKYNEQTDTCVCANGGSFIRYQSGQKGGYCLIDANGNDETPSQDSQEPQWKCPPITNGYSYWRTEYSKCPKVVSTLDDLEKYCASGNAQKTEYDEMVKGLELLRDECKEKLAQQKQLITQSSAAIENASKKLDDIMSGLKISVWKTSEGNFNGARLASDSIAGVVLGTAGGLITSNVVKKNQVKSGFEDISCTVGGQRVADWGDEFTVGIH